MRSEELRDRILLLINGWLQNERVQKDETAVLVLNDLAGDIEVINLKEE